MMNLEEMASVFREFAGIVKALRTPGSGCPWDLEQTHKTLRPYLVEETYEVLEAIDREGDAELSEELGDLLLQIVLHAQLAADRGAFSLTQVIRGIADKMVRRHPHVFGSQAVSDSAEVMRNWEQIKAAERKKGGERKSPLEALPPGLPALMQAQRLGQKAAKAGLDSTSRAEVLAQLKAHLAELETEKPSAERGELVLGELLFGLCQLSRCLEVDAESSLRGASRRFAEERWPRESV